jgi:hypothetical protein
MRATRESSLLSRSARRADAFTFEQVRQTGTGRHLVSSAAPGTYVLCGNADGGSSMANGVVDDCAVSAALSSRLTEPSVILLITHLLSITFGVSRYAAVACRQCSTGS